MTIAETRGLLRYAALFVVSAGFAREYDAVDLLRKPWHLALPLVASVGTSLALYLFLFLAKGCRVPWKDGYRAFLGLYWMTAPLAWLYAIPYERWMSPVAAMQANLATLGLVAVWRVALMVRTIAVLHSVPWWLLVFPVFFFADTVLVCVQFFVPVPIFEFMGGVRLSPADNVLVGAKAAAFILGSLAWPVLLIGSLVCLYFRRPQWTPRLDGIHVPSRSFKALAAASVLVWAPLVIAPQIEQQRGSRIERLWEAGEMEAAAQLLVEWERSELPPAWQPPPRVPDFETLSLFIRMIEALESHPRGWAHAAYERRLLDSLESIADSPSGREHVKRWLESTPEGEAVLKRRAERHLDLDEPWKAPPRGKE